MEEYQGKIVICIFCGSNLEDDWKYCPNCKNNQEKIKCFQCEKEISTHWKYCPHCKEKLEKPNEKESDIIDSANDWINDILRN